MRRHLLPTCRRFALLGTLVAASTALAQSAAPGDTTASAALTGLTQFNTDLDSGGKFHWGAGLASGAVTRQFTPDLAVGLTLRYEYQEWKWEQPTAFGGAGPWSKLNAPAVGLAISYAVASDWRLGFNPIVEWSGEAGANASDSLSYGAVLSATKIFSPDLVFGIGAGVFRQIDETKVFPFLVVNWKINDRLRLNNPLQAGPAGGAGLELAYTLTDRWEVAGGGSYRSYRFRLKDDGPVPGGIGESKFYPVFARLSYTFGPKTRADFYAAAMLGGQLRVANAAGNDVYSDDYGVAPAMGLTISHRF